MVQFYVSLFCAADQLASANFNDDEILSFFDVRYDISESNKKLTPREDQETCVLGVEQDTSIVIFDRIPGSGKTLISELIASKLEKTIIHGTPKNVISDDLACKALGGKKLFNSDFEVEDSNDDFKDVRRKYHWFFNESCRLYTTPDNIFLMSQGYKRHFMLLKAIFNGIVILDEVHECFADSYRRFNLFEMIDKFLYFNIPMILMSGTFPSELKDKVKYLCNEREKKWFEASDNTGELICRGSNIKELKSCMIPQKKKGILRFIDETPNENEVCDFRLSDQQSFNRGYFDSVIKEINRHVNDNEVSAICFGSKKSLLHFMHMMNEFTNYKFQIDYEVVCSPTRVVPLYRDRIYSSLECLKPGNSTRPFKFILCTSYVEMGVDFSVQHIIMEISYLYHVVQMIGRLERWYEFEGNSSFTIVPPITRYDDEYYIQAVYGNKSNFEWLVEFYKKKDETQLNDCWYTQGELDEHFNMSCQHYKDIEWKYIQTCGIFRKINKIQRETTNDCGFNGFYRSVDSVSYNWNGVDYEIPFYKIDKDQNLKEVPDPILFI
jgi:CRISPR/Cas system-associated endonuclease/helicase Cas3